jgi:hypothetical protein
MAATGEPYSVAARALDAAAEPMADAADAAEPAEPAPAAAAEPAEPAAAAGPIAAAAGAAEPTSDSAGALTEVMACANRTLAASSARIEIRTDTDLVRDPVPALRRPLRLRPGLTGRLTRRAARSALGRIVPGADPAELRDHFLHQFGAGFIDFADARYLVDFGGYAQALVDGRRFGGLSGEPLGPRYEIRPYKFRRDDPLDALRKLQSATAARWAGHERVRWTTCRVVTAAVGEDEFTVWIDGRHVQRFQTVERGSDRYPLAARTETVELWEFGVPVDELDWSRLPTFRTPG